MLESWASRRKDVRLIAEGVGDRQAKSVAARSYVMFKPSLTGLTTRLRRSCDQNNLESLTNRRKVIRLVAGVLGDRKGQISRNKVDGHVQNL